MTDEIIFLSPKVELKTTETHGRGFYATEDIPEGTPILKEIPYSWAIQSQYRGIVCDNCSCIYEPPKPKIKKATDGLDPGESVEDYNKRMEFEKKEIERCNKLQKMKKCSRCKLQYYCSTDCQKQAWNRCHKFECKILQTLSKETTLPENHHAFLIFRCMLKVSKNVDELRDREIIDLEPNYEAVHKIEKEVNQCLTFCMSNELIKDFMANMQKKYGFEDPSHVILEFSARLINNRMALGPDEECNGTAVGTGIFPRASMINHNCRPNCLWQTYKNNLIVVKAQTKIKKGEELYISYLDTTMDSKNRQQDLKLNYNFDCDCQGCRTGDIDALQMTGGDLSDLIEKGDAKAIDKLPIYNIGVLRKLQQSFDEAVRYEMNAEKAYKIGERVLKGMSYYLNDPKFNYICRPDFKRACGVQYMFMGELALTLTKDPRITQAYLFKAEAILKVTDSDESTVFARIRKIRSLLCILHAAHQKAYGDDEK